MIIERASPNFDQRPTGTPIDMLVLHYTGMQSAEPALARLRDPGAKVSAHWLITEAGAIYGLVPEAMRAWHAGVGFWRGAVDINARSVGIELVNPGHEFGYRAFPEAQMAALLDLARDVIARHAIPPRNVVGHSDIAPRRKMDPGELFDWRRLAGTGLALWPTETDAHVADAGAVRTLQGSGAVSALDTENCIPGADAIRTLLSEIGYEISDLDATVKAFQRRFRPACVDGHLDRQTGRLIRGLVQRITAEPQPS